MKGFIIDATYRILNDRAYVTLFGRLESGESFMTLNHARPYFYILASDLKIAQEIESFDHEEVDLKDFQENKVVKIILDIPSDVPKLRQIFEKEAILTYEADIPFARRFLIDNKLQGSIEIDGEFDYQNEIRVYREPTLIPTETKTDLKVMAVDIETDVKFRKLYCISIAQGDYRNVLIVSDQKLKGAESLESEEDVLERFMDIIQEQDPDIITGWNFIDFDLKFLRKRCKRLQVPFRLGRTPKDTRLTVRSGYFSTSKAHAEGRQIIDTMAWIKDTTKLKNYKLETASQHFLKDGKLLVGNHRFNEIEDFYHNDQQKLVDYNLKDSVLVLQILKASKVLDLYITRSKITGLLIDEVKGSIASLDSLYIKRTKDLGYVVPSVRHSSSQERITGGYVMDSVPGIYDNIIVLDFKSLYPSLMRTFNIDPLAFGKPGITAPNGATFSKDVAIMPEILQDLWQVREQYRKAKNEAGRYAIKIQMNSFFGVLASPLCRFYSLDMGNAITSFAQFFIKKTAELIEKEGYQVIYSDTDSCFIVAKNNPKKVGQELEKKLNMIIAKFIKKQFGVTSYLELEFEKIYTKFIMPKLRGAEKGAKKRYAGLVKGKLEITGMEAVRGDWTQLAKTFQEKLLTKVFKEEPVRDFVVQFLSDLKKGKLDHLLIYKKALRKSLKDYQKTTPPHVKAARQVKNFQGNVVEYVYTKSGVRLAELAEGNYDYKHYIDKQIKPLAESILVFYNINFKELTTGQKNLFSF